MPVTVVTFDFHNTLAICDEWFELEVRTIVPRFLEWYESRHGVHVTPDLKSSGAALYRALRQDIMLHGREHDVLTCVLHVLGLLTVPATAPEVKRGIDMLMRESLRNSRPGEGVIGTVRELHSSGVRLGVVSSAAHHAFLEWSLATFGVLHLFDVIGSSARMGYYKSTGRIYERVLQLMDVPPTRAVHIGDSHHYDVEPAREVGMRTVWLDLGHDVGGDEHLADLRVTTLRGVVPRLRTIRGWDS